MYKDEDIELIYPYEERFWDIFTNVVNSENGTSYTSTDFKYEKGRVKVKVGNVSFEIIGRRDDGTYWKVDTIINGENLGRYDWGAVPDKSTKHLWSQLKQLGKV